MSELPALGRIRLGPRALVALFVSLQCVMTLGINLPALAASGSAAPTPAPGKKHKQDPALKGLPITELTADEAILHALNRLAYGPRPGDIERVRQMGLAKWIDQQLSPNSIDDKALDARLERFPTLKMSSAQLLADYPQPKQAEKQAQRSAQAQAQNGGEAAQRPGDAAAATIAKDMQASDAQPADGAAPENSASPAPSTQTQTPAPASPPEGADAPSPMKQPDAPESAQTRVRPGPNGGDPGDFLRAIGEGSHKPARIVAELSIAKVDRAIYSQRQLQQVMDDFWFNHFNVFAGKGADRWYLTSYERDVIQPHTLGKFKDLLTATAKSPAMLFYLDNFLSADPNAAQRLAAQRAMRQRYRRFPGGFPPPQNPQARKNGRGLNENYGRELMELHTLGVDGGYTQKDVTEVARCFTGWTIDKPRLNPQFKFDDRLHDPAPKLVLGKKIDAGGIKDGDEVIDLLVRNPSTAKFISTKLARRFVSDTPPPALVERMAKTFQSSDGDIRAVMKTMIWSPEFWSRNAYRAKVKTPFELVASSARALGADIDAPLPFVGWVGRIGEPLYQCQPPTGYADKAEAWVNTGALLNRLNFSLALAGNKIRGSRTDVASLLGMNATGDANAALDRAVQVFLGGQAAPGTVDTLRKQLDNPQIVQAKLDDPVKQLDLGVIAGLVLGAPEFQRR